MNIGDSIRGAFRRHKIDFDDETTRNELIAQAIETAKEKRQKSSVDDAVKPILNLIREFEKHEHNPLPVIVRGCCEFLDSATIKKELDQHLLKISRIPKEALPFFEELLVKDVYNITIWRRVIMDYEYHELHAGAARTRMLFINAVGPHFPNRKESTWFDIETESDAKDSLQKHLNVMLDHFEPEYADFKCAKKFSHTIAMLRPEDSRSAMIVATITARDTEITESVLPLIEEAFEAQPENQLLKRYLALGLAKFQRDTRAEDAFNLLDEIVESNPDDKVVYEAFVELFDIVKIDAEKRIKVLKRMSESNRGDLKLRVQYIKEQVRFDTSKPGILSLITEALAYAPQDSDLKQMQAQVLMQNQNPIQAISILERTYQNGDDSEQILTSLANCYAMIQRRDKRALKIYLRVLESGTASSEVVEQLGECLAMDTGHGKMKHFYCEEVKKHKIESLACKVIELEKEPLNLRLPSLIKLTRDHPEDPKLIFHIAQCVVAKLSRTSVRQVLALPPRLSLMVLEKAYELQPDALVLTTQLAKSRLSQGIRDNKTADLLSEICIRDSGEIDMRLRRADLMRDMGEYSKALSLYRELYARASSGTASAHSTNASDLESEMDRILFEILEMTLKMENPDEEDLDFLYQHLQSPETDTEHLRMAAMKCLDNHIVHAGQQVLLERAFIVHSDEVKIQRNLSIVRLTKGKPDLFLSVLSDLNSEKDRQEMMSILWNRVRKLKELDPSFILTSETGQVLAFCVSFFPESEQNKIKDNISEFCEA